MRPVESRSPAMCEARPHPVHRAHWYGALAALALSLSALGAGQPSDAGDGEAFTDATAGSGLQFIHENGATGALTLPEVTGAGGAVFDYDNDGDLDLYAVQGGALRIEVPGGDPPAGDPRDRLFRNELAASGTGPARFTDVTRRSGIHAPGYGMCTAVGDIDNDGWLDLYVTNLGANQLFRNNGDGTFADISTASGTADHGWSASATFVDYDRDGWLDLYIVNYVDFAFEMRRACFSRGSARDYCNPQVYDPLADRLYHNERDGTFADVSATAGILEEPRAGLGVLAADLNADGWTDFYVANDGDPNQLWINDGGRGTFTDGALLAGVAVNRTGQREGGMGVDAADIDEDGDDDLFVTNLDNESNTMYVRVADAVFEDRTIQTGLLRPSFGLTGFGTRFLDYDHDGSLDLFVVNGAVRHLEDQVRAGDPYPLKQRNQLFRADGRGRYVETPVAAFQGLQVSRGAAVGDLDNDGDPDIVVFNNSGPLQLLENQTNQRRHWLGVQILDGGRDALQARVELRAAGGASRWQRVHTDGSYCASSDPRLVFGLGADESLQTVRVHWPDGSTDDYEGLVPDRYWVLERGRAARRP